MGTGTFLQSCPVCGRRLNIAHEYDGTRVMCYTCYAAFVARNLRSSMPQMSRPHDASTPEHSPHEYGVSSRRIMVYPGVAG